MGYFGLNRWEDFDEAANLMGDITSDIIKRLEAEVNVVNNEYNTNRCVNVALICESLLLNFGNIYESKLKPILQRAVKLITIELKSIEQSKPSEWRDPDSRQEHIDAYKRMIGNMNKIISKIY